MALHTSGAMSFNQIYSYWVSKGVNRGYSVSGYLSTVHHYDATGPKYFPANNLSFYAFYGKSPVDEWNCNCDCNCACK